jgi:hypothetical protein
VTNFVAVSPRPNRSACVDLSGRLVVLIVVTRTVVVIHEEEKKKVEDFVRENEVVHLVEEWSSKNHFLVEIVSFATCFSRWVVWRG